MKTTLLTIAALFITATALAAPPAKDDDLPAILDAHVKAIQARDLAALEKTITSGDDLELILPNGKRLTTRKQYVDFHREWFKETNWTWTLEPQTMTVVDDAAIITARTRYEERDGAKTTQSENWLSLVFLKEKDGWRLVHDQNTRIASGP